MKHARGNIGTTLLVASILFAGLLMLDGCKKSEPAPPPTTTGTMEGMQGHEGHDHAAMTDKASEATEVATAATEQTICPVMHNPINKDIFVEYKGKKVYFCCPECEGKFKAEPEKYIAKLPQFQN